MCVCVCVWRLSYYHHADGDGDGDADADGDDTHELHFFSIFIVNTHHHPFQLSLVFFWSLIILYIYRTIGPHLFNMQRIVSIVPMSENCFAVASVDGQAHIFRIEDS